MFLLDAKEEPVFDLPLNISRKTPSQALAMFRANTVDNSVPEQIIRATHDSSTILRTMFRLLKCATLYTVSKIVWQNRQSKRIKYRIDAHLLVDYCSMNQLSCRASLMTIKIV